MRKKTKRKHYKLVDPIRHAIEGAALIPASINMQLQTREQAAISAFMGGVQTKEDWRELAMMCNISEQLCLMGVGAIEVREPLDKAQDALRAAKKRLTNTGRLGFNGLELTAMREIIEYHDLQRTSIPRKDYERAIEAVRLKIICNDVSVERLDD